MMSGFEMTSMIMTISLTMGCGPPPPLSPQKLRSNPPPPLCRNFWGLRGGYAGTFGGYRGGGGYAGTFGGLGGGMPVLLGA